MGEKEKMVWSPVWLNVLQTIVWLPFKSHAQSSFDKNVLLSNPYSKMVGFCFGLAMPTLGWYTTLLLHYTAAACSQCITEQVITPTRLGRKSRRNFAVVTFAVAPFAIKPKMPL